MAAYGWEIHNGYESWQIDTDGTDQFEPDGFHESRLVKELWL
jgi:hypothetical protein